MKISNSTRSIILVTLILCVAAASISLFYYKSGKDSFDPRIAKTREEYKTYNKLLKEKDCRQIAITLKTIENIYFQFEDYRNSYETGLVLNSEAVNWLTMATSEFNDSLRTIYLDSAKLFSVKSIRTFENWLEEYEHLSRNEIIIKIEKYYNTNDSIFSNCNIVEVINKRADGIVLAQKDTPRQLSLAYTNLGSVFQYYGEYKLALQTNRRALEIWGDNETAKKNIVFLKERAFK
ncbi:MAG: hypothetical protein U0W24_09065 [Bacteroidales bacterium]